MTANSAQTRKAKGRRLTQYVCAKILKFCERRLPFVATTDIRPVPSSVAGVDVWMSEAAKRLFPYSVECKNQEAIQIWACLKQTECNTEVGTKPLLVFKRNNSKVYVCLELDDFLGAIR